MGKPDKVKMTKIVVIMDMILPRKNGPVKVLAQRGQNLFRRGDAVIEGVINILHDRSFFSIWGKGYDPGNGAVLAMGESEAIMRSS